MCPVQLRIIVFFLIVLYWSVSMQGLLGKHFWGVLKSAEGSINIIWHWDINIAVYIIAIDCETTVFFSSQSVVYEYVLPITLRRFCASSLEKYLIPKSSTQRHTFVGRVLCFRNSTMLMIGVYPCRAKVAFRCLYARMTACFRLYIPFLWGCRHIYVRWLCSGSHICALCLLGCVCCDPS